MKKIATAIGIMLGDVARNAVEAVRAAKPLLWGFRAGITIGSACVTVAMFPAILIHETIPTFMWVFPAITALDIWRGLSHWYLSALVRASILSDECSEAYIPAEDEK